VAIAAAAFATAIGAVARPIHAIVQAIVHRAQRRRTVNRGFTVASSSCEKDSSRPSGLFGAERRAKRLPGNTSRKDGQSEQLTSASTPFRAQHERLRSPDAIAVAEVESALKSGAAKDPNKVSKLGSIVYSAAAPSGKPSEYQIDLQPGEYLALGGSGEGGPKVHTLFTVTAAKSPATVPTPQATIKTIEFGFRGPDTLHDGEVVRFENEGYLVHMDAALPVKSKKAGGQVVKDLLTGREKGLEKLIASAPIEFAGPLTHESFQQTTITAKPGWYVQACFMDTQDGRSHTLLGMERIFQIVK
jgi:hypothetical protein